MQCLGPTLWNALVAADSPAGLGRRLSLVGVGQLRRWIWSATHGEAGWASGPEGERGLACGPGPALLRALVGCRRAIGVGTFGGNAEPAAARRPWHVSRPPCFTAARWERGACGAASARRPCAAMKQPTESCTHLQSRYRFTLCLSKRYWDRTSFQTTAAFPSRS